MKALLLAAGYGTRLYPLTLDRPKALLPVGGRPLIEHMMAQLEAAPEIEELVVVTNDRFAPSFEQWVRQRPAPRPIRILNDGTTCDAERLGAVADIRFALEEAGLRSETLYVLSTDNLPRFGLRGIIGLSREQGTSAVFACREPNRARLVRGGVAVLDERNRIVEFQEKPAKPKSEFRVPSFYVYTADAVALIGPYLDEGGNRDAPGHFLAWLVKRCPVHALVTELGTYDIGTPESYRAVCAMFENPDGAGGTPR